MLRPDLLRHGHACASSNLPGLLCPSCVEQLCVLHALPRPCTASGATYVCSICALPNFAFCYRHPAPNQSCVKPHLIWINQRH